MDRLPAAFRQAETREGLRRLITSAKCLKACGGSADHLAAAIAHGSLKQGLSDEEFITLFAWSEVDAK